MKFFSAVISYIQNLGRRINESAQRPFQEESRKVLQELQKRSPVDSGTYLNSWRTRKEGNSIVFFNDDPKFPLMEFGAEIDSAPWYFPGKRKKKTGKLIVAQGMVWAGGLNPGHQYTVGGAINPVLDRFRSAEIGQTISEVVLKRI